MIGSVRRNLQPSLPELIVGRVQPLDVSGLTLGAIATVFTIGYVANMLGGDEAVNRHLPRRRMPSRLRVNENSVTALAEHGIECLRQIIADEQTAWVPSGASEVPSGDCWRYPPPPPRPANPLNRVIRSTSSSVRGRRLAATRWSRMRSRSPI